MNFDVPSQQLWIRATPKGVTQFRLASNDDLLVFSNKWPLKLTAKASGKSNGWFRLFISFWSKRLIFRGELLVSGRVVP